MSPASEPVPVRGCASDASRASAGARVAGRPAAWTHLAQRFGLATACLLADLAAKGWADRVLVGRGTLWLWQPWLALQLVHNRGAALGLGSGVPWVWTAIAAAAVPVLAVLLARTQHGGTGLALVLAGAAGNLVSRLAAGSVTDFLRLSFWPGVFNLADVFLRVGVVLLLLAAWRPNARPARGRGPLGAGSTADAASPAARRPFPATQPLWGDEDGMERGVEPSC